MDYSVVEGDVVTLRPPERRDVEPRRRAGRDAELVWGFGDDPATAGPLSEEDAKRWYERMKATGGWVIEFGGEAVGMATLDMHPYATRTARYSIGIWRADLRGRGLGEAATRLVLRHAFRILGLHRIELRVLVRNAGAIRCYEKCGFKIEGRLREVLLENGAWEDELAMAILEQDLDAQ